MGKRSRPFGHVYTRGGTWTARATVDGQRRWKSFPGVRDARDWLAQLGAAVARGEAVGKRPPSETTFADFWRVLRPVLAARHVPATFAVEEGRYRRIEAHFGARALAEIGPADVEDILAKLAEKRARKAPTQSCAEDPSPGGEARGRRSGGSAGTLNRYLALLSVVFREARARGFTDGNPARGVKRQREELRPVPFLDARDLALLAAHAPADLRPAVVLAAETGLRRGELAALEWKDVRIAEPGPPPALVVRRSKGKRPRTVPLTPKAVETLHALRDSRRVVPLTGPDPVFPDVAAEPWRLSQAFARAARRAGHAGLRFHDLRHAYASGLVRAGVPIPTVAALLGHATLAVTMRYACHAPEGAEIEAVRRLAAARAEALLGSDGAALSRNLGRHLGLQKLECSQVAL